MCIAVPDTCILAESNQLIRYLSPSINWLAIFGGSSLLNKKMFILQGLLHPQAFDGVL